MKFILAFLISLSVFAKLSAKDFYIALNGSDRNPGTLSKPFATIAKAKLEALKFKNESVNIFLRAGVYYLDETLIFTIADSRKEGKEVIISPYMGDEVVVKGSKKLDLNWILNNGVYTAKITRDQLIFDQLYVNGQLMQMARYPNYQKGRLPFGGVAEDVLGPDRIKKWAKPQGAYLHAMQASMWGGFSFLIKGKTNAGELEMEGGWQNNRPSAIHKQYRFIENVFEELDTLNEWYYDKTKQIVFLKTDIDLSGAVVEVPQIETLLEVRGSAKEPVKNIIIRGITFSHTLRTFMKNKEQLLRSDWTIYRKGAITLDGAENINIEKCIFKDNGANVIVYSNYNKNNTLSGSHIFNAGGNAVVFVGDPKAVRSPSFQYSEFVAYENMDKTAGPKGNNYPISCTVYDNLIHDIGQVEKQTAGVQISMAQDIKISHNTIYDVPRAGININEGTWGGHIIEFNDVFNTVLETGDHGAFNSWGRDRFWHPTRAVMDTLVAKHPQLIFLDAVKPTVLFNNRFRCDNGWDIDLDDGSSNYMIQNNVCLNGGLKLREGFKRTVENNIIINNSFHPHVWFKNSDDVFKHNILGSAYFPIRITDWGNNIDSNYFPDEVSLKKAQAFGTDKNSLAGEITFENAIVGDYRIDKSSKAFDTGFKNFDMNFGVVSEDLRNRAKKVAIPQILPLVWKEDATYDFLGIKVKNLNTLAERSATGMPSETGVLILDIAPNSLMSATLKINDVILGMGEYEINNVKDLVTAKLNSQSKKTAVLKIFRDQKENSIMVNLK
ncbi:PDZ/DHR/GLGF domain protein [Pseudopedobacter saltans DSM 12145]|uniref:PDZ/DHR/GLGF domain protein n=1 Tax=Pseudopedobacter saltans (strain ATCC 51119 / DSM 12145 / JCM 21818 / CCUG 39354 / LMG 10337 / NBRC 100064 / NCIMB 13643) TaxID=762903 RepID=F0SAI6_PSESL|nr:PDZ domain-containing protein [Pseudopedobacter saltans]ADY52606.1 PDZ/DHR/GLGF domain protein [Pseudopedobacter saltans DSM 12145]